MTRNANARLAGFAYLFYIAVAFPSMQLASRATRGASMADKLASMAQHATDLRFSLVLSFLGSLSALVLAVTLWALTRDQDRELAMLGLTCRVAEGVMGGMSIPMTMGLLWLATATGASAADPAAAQAVAAFVIKQPLYGASFFAVGSLLFSWLLLRGRMIPTALAWVGVVASALLVVASPLADAGILRGPLTQLMWLPMAAFEIPLGIWWLAKGDTTRAQSTPRS